MRGGSRGGFRWRTSAVAVFCLLVLGQTVFVGRADAVTTTIACGQNVTTDVVLQADVGPCAGPGFTVHGATNITIDLNGHSVLGPDNLTPVTGVHIASSSGVTLKRGTVSGFAFGIEVSAAPGTTITEMIVSGNRGGLTTESTVLSHTGAGIQVNASHGTAIRRSRIVGNGPLAGIRVINTNDMTVEGNVVQGNAVRQLSSTIRPDVVVQVTAGILVFANQPRFPSGFRAVIRNNQVLDNGWHGIFLDAFTRDDLVVNNQVHRNGLDQVDPRIVAHGDGILVAALGNVVEGNSVTGNGRNGIEIGLPENQIRRNVALGNVQRPGTFPAFDLHDRIANCAGNVWSGNVYGTISQPCVAG